MARVGGNRAATTGPVVAAPGRRSPRGSVVGGCLAEQVEAQVRDRRAEPVAGVAAGATAPASRRCPWRARSAARGACPGWARRWRRAHGRRRRRSARSAAGALVPGAGDVAEVGDEALDEHPTGRCGACLDAVRVPVLAAASSTAASERRVSVRRVSASAALLSADRAMSSPSARSSTAHITLASSSTPSSTSSSSRPGERCGRRRPDDELRAVQAGRAEQRPRPGASSGGRPGRPRRAGSSGPTTSSKLSLTRSRASVTTTPELGGDASRAGAGDGTGKVNQSLAWSQISSMSSAVARCDRSGGKPPMSTSASSTCHHRGAGAPG